MNTKILIVGSLLMLPLITSAAEPAVPDNDVTMDISTMEIRANPAVSSPFAEAVARARENLRARLEEIRASGASPKQQAAAREEANEAYHEEVNRARAEARAQRRKIIEKRQLQLDANLEARLEEINKQTQ